MQNNNQTAVDWLVEKVNSDCLTSTFIDPRLAKQANEIFRKQIMIAWQIWQSGTAEKYYNETYGDGSSDHIVDTNEMIPDQFPDVGNMVETNGNNSEKCQMLEISDEEIEKHFTSEYPIKTIFAHKIEGAKWYREQLRQKK